ncbi:hypothetical protein Ferp_1745 [Ferroglobus placidus DSM 10642]|uniref:Uncharacterized protein n=1 Tax=Ferroglobus placidus (strain DSM 10642 / AEDII12DO) TaxID=589924 RepID=D3RZH6_FERPA|nr:hypothetical protein [Ferroglobus placidus]ADC65889.1 hypothetical protein Ferp_1745 [Ferroglobus placidus DSM 10642]
MQRVEELKKKLEEIVRELEEMQSLLKVKALGEAVERIKIAIKELEGFEKKGSESFSHYDLKIKLLEMFKGSHYLESERTKLSKFGVRPDAVVIKDDAVVLIEVEKDKKNFLKKVRKLKKVKDKLLESPIFTGRKIKFVFGLVEFEIDEELKKEVLSLGDAEVYSSFGGELKRLL